MYWKRNRQSLKRKRRGLPQSSLTLQALKAQWKRIMPNVLLGVTGSVAAIYTPQLFTDLRQAGHDVKIVATTLGLLFLRSRNHRTNRWASATRTS